MFFQCINICQVPWEVLKTAAFGLGFQHLQRDLANVNAWKTMFDPYIDTLSEKASFYKLLLPLFWKRSTLKGKNLLLWEQILSFYSRSLFKRGLVYRKVNWKLQNLSPCTKKKWNIYPVYSFTLNKQQKAFWLLRQCKCSLAGLDGSVGCALRLETRRSRVQPPPRSATFFHGDWLWNIFYGHSLPSADSRRAFVSFWRKNVHNTG